MTAMVVVLLNIRIFLMRNNGASLLGNSTERTQLGNMYAYAVPSMAILLINDILDV